MSNDIRKHSPLDPPPRPPSRWRFSLGSILLLMTVLSLALGWIRTVPMSGEMRLVMLWLSIVWGVVALFVLAPLWLRYGQLQRDIDAGKEKTKQWLKEFRASHTEPDSPPQDRAQGPPSEP